MAPSPFRLCERLLLLKTCGGPKDSRERCDLVSQSPTGPIKIDTRTELTILNSICHVLQTDEDGDRVAAALDKDYSPPKLVLARSIPVTQNHIDDTREFLSVIQGAQPERLIRTLFPIIHRHHVGSLQKKISGIHRALIEFYTGPASCPAELTDYHPLPSLRQEFPVGTAVLDDLYPGEKPSCREMVCFLLQRSIDLSSIDVTSMTLDRALASFLNLLNVARLLRHARLFQSWSTTVGDTTLRGAIDAILQYAHLLNVLDAVKHYYPAREEIPFRWINISEDDQYHQAILELPNDPVMILSHTLGSSPETEPCLKLYENYPQLKSDWAERRTVRTRLHPEMQIILELSYLPIHYPFGKMIQRAIGLSSDSCMCCMQWVKVFNLTAHMCWTLSTSDNPAPLDETWRGAGKRLLEEVMGARGTFTPDRQVLDFVRSLVIQKFDKLPEW